MAEKLSRTASGTRHHRWAKQILARGIAHQKYNYLLTPAQQAALATETATLATLVTDLGNAVMPYRAFVEEAYLDVRAAQGVADYVCDEAQRDASGKVQPRRKDVDEFLKPQGGFTAIFSEKPLSRVLRAGREATEAMARKAGQLLGSIPKQIVDAQAESKALLAAADLLKKFIDEEKNNVDPQRTPLKLAVTTAVYNLREGLEQMDGRLRTNFPESFIDSLYPELDKHGKPVADDEEDDDTPDKPAAPAAAAASTPAATTPNEMSG